MEKDIIEKIRVLTEESGVSVGAVLAELKHDEKLRREAEMMKEVEANEPLIGKCFCAPADTEHSMFPPMKTFYKVISNRSENEYCVECLIYDEHPTYWYEYQAHKANLPGDCYLGHFDFEAFRTDSIMARSFETMTEITEEEFNECARRYLDELLELHWVADHYRHGDKFPTDPGWRLSSE